MKNYAFHKELKTVYDKAVETYAKGGRNANTFFNGSEIEFLKSIGATPIEIYDFAEDLHEWGYPDWETVLLIQSVRRDYFLLEQKGKYFPDFIDEASLPEKDAEARGMAWLSRIIPKAKAKLKGELPPSLMYCCGGDRDFLKKHDIHPAEFLRVVWMHLDDDEAIIDWVVDRKENPPI